MLIAECCSRLGFQKMPSAERRVLSSGKKLEPGHGHSHSGQVNPRESDPVPDLDHNSFFHDPVQQIGVGGKFGAVMHFAHYSSRLYKNEAAQNLAKGLAQQLQISIPERDASGGKAHQFFVLPGIPAQDRDPYIVKRQKSTLDLGIHSMHKKNIRARLERFSLRVT